jgi:hypothetical protein
MGVGTSMFLIAVGAILRWGVDVQSTDFNIGAIGAILMVVGAAGLVLSLAFWSTWGGFGGRSRRTVVTEDRAGRRETIEEQERL